MIREAYLHGWAFLYAGECFPCRRHEATIFTNDAVKLGQQLGTEINKSSALELVQNQSVNQDLGLAQ